MIEDTIFDLTNTANMKQATKKKYDFKQSYEILLSLSAPIAIKKEKKRTRSIFNLFGI